VSVTKEERVAVIDTDDFAKSSVSFPDRLNSSKQFPQNSMIYQKLNELSASPSVRAV
jgi:hypothetical protein